jgi:hypothetical protein
VDKLDGAGGKEQREGMMEVCRVLDHVDGGRRERFALATNARTRCLLPLSEKSKCVLINKAVLTTSIHHASY